MRSALCFLTLASALLGTRPAWGAPSHGEPAGLDRNRVRVDFVLYSALPAGSLVVCKAEFEAEPGHLDQSRARVAGTTVIHDTSSVCAVEIPVCWTGESSANSLTLRYEIDVEPRPGTQPVILTSGVLNALRAGLAGSRLTLSLAPSP